MKKFLVAVAFGLMAIAAQAEASFDQIQTLIQQQNYSAAEKGLEEIIRNHPKSAKAFYAMAQAQAGLGNQDKARKALDIATGLNPTLDFAPASSVQSLRDAITPQVSKIEAIEESHTMRNVMILLLLGVVGFAIWYAREEMKRKEEEEAAEAERVAERDARHARQREEARQAREALDKAEAERLARHQAAEAALKAHKNYGHERFDPANPDKLKSVAQFKQEQSAAAEKQRLFLEAQERREAQARADAAEASARMYRTSAQTVAQPAPTVVHTSSSGTDMLTGVLIGNMLSNSGHHHDTERTVVRETVREVPAPSRDSSWDDKPSTPSRSSSWDDDSSSSSKSSSSWSSSSSSDSSSSWDSGSSSSSDSSSSSSWD